jgi:hypothetical protein
LCSASQANASRASGLFWRHASPDIFVREHVEMGVKLVLEFLVKLTG